MEADCKNPEVAADELEPLPVVLRIRAVKSRPIAKRWTARRLALQAMAPLTLLAATVPLFALILFVFWQLRQPVLGEAPPEIVAAPAPTQQVNPEPLIPDPKIAAVTKMVQPAPPPSKPEGSAAPSPTASAVTDAVANAATTHVPAKPDIAAIQQASFSSNGAKAEANATAAVDAGAVQIRSIYPIHSVLARFRPEADKLATSAFAQETAAAVAPVHPAENNDSTNLDPEMSTAAMTAIDEQPVSPVRADVAPAHYRVQKPPLPPVADHRLAKQSGLFQGKVKFWTSNRKLTPTTTTSRPAQSTSAKVIRPEPSEGKSTEPKAWRVSFFGLGKRTPVRREHFDPTVVKIAASEKSSLELSAAPADIEHGNARLDATNLVPAAPTAAGIRPTGDTRATADK